MFVLTSVLMPLAWASGWNMEGRANLGENNELCLSIVDESDVLGRLI